MTIKIIKKEIRELEDFIEVYENAGVGDKNYEEHILHLKTIKTALEKQIPKKVENYYTEDTIYGDEKAKFGSCCYCGSEVQEGMHFCMDCGQALDWSDT